ncbi:MAG: hypothetical protein HC831_12985 [Chloroflexia bacterium]|nr:hypothetical protein [Chloroflexia bacterium]
MKKFLKGLLVIAFLSFIATSCEKKEDVETAPVLPPYESMKVDFGKMANGKKSVTDINSSVNFAAAGITVGVWNVMLTLTLAVPVGAFAHSFSTEPVYLGDLKWQWSYDVNVFGGKYNARLTGTIRTNDVKWEMYIAREGINSFPEFLWFEGTSDLDGNSGQWVLYHSYEVQEAVLQIDWQKEADQIGDVKYTYIRETDNGSQDQLANGSYLNYGLQDATFNAFYTIHSVTRANLATEGFKDIFIEWSTTTYDGRIKSELYYGDTDWHCWDTEGLDIICP